MPAAGGADAGGRVKEWKFSRSPDPGDMSSCCYPSRETFVRVLVEEARLAAFIRVSVLLDEDLYRSAYFGPLVRHKRCV